MPLHTRTLVQNEGRSIRPVRGLLPVREVSSPRKAAPAHVLIAPLLPRPSRLATGSLLGPNGFGPDRDGPLVA